MRKTYEVSEYLLYQLDERRSRWSEGKAVKKCKGAGYSPGLTVSCGIGADLLVNIQLGNWMKQYSIA
jgi:hypothetical protein